MLPLANSDFEFNSDLDLFPLSDLIKYGPYRKCCLEQSPFELCGTLYAQFVISLTFVQLSPSIASSNVSCQKKFVRFVPCREKGKKCSNWWCPCIEMHQHNSGTGCWYSRKSKIWAPRSTYGMCSNCSPVVDRVYELQWREPEVVESRSLCTLQRPRLCSSILVLIMI